MSLKFLETYEELKTKLKSLFEPNKWIELGPNHKQYRHSSGAIVNWYPTTGTLNFQGKPTAAEKVESFIKQLLEGNEITESFDIEESVTETIEIPQTEKLLGHNYSNSELIFGLVSPVGTEYKSVVEYIKERLRIHNYEVKIIHVSSDVITQLKSIQNTPNTEYERINTFMDLGNLSREETGDNSILALGIASEIFKDRDSDEKGGVKPKRRIAYIINSLKHPTEVE